MIFGVDYYPEHWPEYRWAEDAKQMNALGIDLVRIGEFSWSLLQPSEERYEFVWLDRIIEILASSNLKVVLGTPTAAPPAWLSRNYPETLPVDEQGRRRNFGARRHYCPNHPTFRRFTEGVVNALAERYGHDQRVTGWQIDNEFGEGRTSRCYCPVCISSFQAWLGERYGNLSALNEAWGTIFWSQIYTEWDQIGAPIQTGLPANPSQILDYYRFMSASFTNFQQSQLNIINELADRPRQFITHNFMGLFPDLNYYELAKPLDFVSWDSYPTGNLDHWRSTLLVGEELFEEYAPDVGDPLITGMGHDFIRGLSEKPFWVMEQQPGSINWGIHNQGIRPGSVRLWVWHALAHGASRIVFFRWRASLYAQEQYHSGLLHHDGTPDVGYKDLKAMQMEMDLLVDLAQQPVEPAQVAIVVDYDNLWALEIQPHTKGFSYIGYIFNFYQALMRLGIPVDLISSEDDLHPYRLVIAPAFHINRTQFADNIEEFVVSGGSVLFGVRSGMKTASNLVEPRPLPGIYRHLIGAVVTDWMAINPENPSTITSPIKDINGSTRLWNESLAPDPGTQILATYTSGSFAKQAALTLRKFGQGSFLYMGWYPQLHQTRSLLRYLAAELNIDRLGRIPPGMVIKQRGDLILLLNFTDSNLQANIGGELVTIPPREIHVRQKIRPFVLKSGFTRPLNRG